MNTSKGSILLYAIVLLSLSACATASSTQEETAVIDKIVLTNKDSGTNVTVKLGDQFMIQLDGNLTTGYAWEVDEIDSTFLKQVGEVEYREKSNPDSSSDEETLTGTPGEFVFTFEVLQTGETSLKLIYHRSFEEGVEPEEIFTVTFTIQ